MHFSIFSSYKKKLNYFESKVVYSPTDDADFYVKNTLKALVKSYQKLFDQGFKKALTWGGRGDI